MTTASTGFGTSFGLGEESTYGTAVSRTNWLRARSASLATARPKVPRGHLGTSGAASRNRRAFTVTEQSGGGGMEVFAAYDDSTLLLLKHALGAVATTGVGPYTHTFSLADLPTGLTVEQLHGDTGKSQVYAGCKVSTWDLSIEAGSDGMVLTCDVISKGGVAMGSAGTPSYSANGEIVDPVDAGTFDWNGSSYTVRSVKVSGDNKLATRESLGTLDSLEPTPTDFLECKVEVTLEVPATNPLHAAMLADTQADGSIVFTGTTNNKMTINIQNAIVDSVSQDVSGADVILQTVSFTCLSDGTNEGVTIEIVNDNATATAN